MLPRLASRVALAGLLLAAAGACFRGTLPARQYYRLQLPDTLIAAEPVAHITADAPLAGSLAVGSYRAPGLYGRSGLVFRLNGNEYGSYPAREWAVPLADQLGLFTEAVLRKTPLTRDGALYEPPNERSHTYLWRGTIREFEEVDRPDGSVHASVRLEAVLVRAADDSVLWTRSVRLERQVADPSMNGIVEALSQLAVEAVASLVSDARVHLAGPAAARVTGTPR